MVVYPFICSAWVQKYRGYSLPFALLAQSWISKIPFVPVHCACKVLIQHPTLQYSWRVTARLKCRVLNGKWVYRYSILLLSCNNSSKIVFKGWLTVELIPKCHFKNHFLLSTENVSSLIHSQWFVSLAKTKRSTKPQYQALSNIYFQPIAGCRHWDSSLWCCC